MLTNKQIKALHLLAEDTPTKQIAIHLKVSERTLSNWQNIPDFIKAKEDYYAKFISEMRTASVRHFDRMLVKADEALERALNGEFGGTAAIHAMKTVYERAKILSAEQAPATNTVIKIDFATPNDDAEIEEAS